VGNRDLIRVAVARNPDQAIPLSGVYWGDRDDDLGIEVEVNVKTESAPLPDAANDDPLLAEVAWNKNDGRGIE
jgi:hypothetical protein